MTHEEFDRWRPGAVAAYASDKVRAGAVHSDHAEALADDQFSDLLPDGAATQHHHLLVAERSGDPVGTAWLHVPAPLPGAQTTAFVFDIEIAEGLRGHGLGDAVLGAMEELARAYGASAIALHVFGDNLIARRLYEKRGYAVTDLSMRKAL